MHVSREPASPPLPLHELRWADAQPRLAAVQVVAARRAAALQMSREMYVTDTGLLAVYMYT